MNAPVSLGQQDLANMARTRGWARFLSVVYFLAMAGMLLGALAMAALSGRMAAQLGGRWMPGVVLGAMLVGVLACGLYGVLNWRYSSALYDVDRNQGPALVNAFRNLRLLWMFTAVFYGLGLLFGLLSLIGTLTGVTPGQPGPDLTGGAGP
jgi:hypothetical protein